MKNSPYQQYNDHKPNINLELFDLTQPIYITLRFFTATSAQYFFSCKTWRKPVTENWGNKMIYSHMHKSFRGQEDVTLVMMLSLAHLSPRGMVMSFACPLPRQESALWCTRLSCKSAKTKLPKRRINFPLDQCTALSSSIPYVGWMKCTMNLYSKRSGK